MTALKVIAGIVSAVVLVVVIGVVGWQFGWWLKEKNVDRQVQIDNRQLGTQTAWRDEAYDLINQASLLPEGAPQASALEQQACSLINRLTPSYLDDELVVFYEQECA